jgi:hypothetical protein
LFCILILARVASAGEFTYDRFVERLKAKNIRSVEAALEEVPPEHWAHYVLVYDSGSLQAASPTHPRAILHGRNAKFILAYNASSDAIETIQFRDATKEFEFHVIRFPTEKNRLKETDFSPSNPSSCRECHQKSLRPNWHSYPRWEGAYGSYDDGLNPTEKENYATFVTKFSSLPRYHKLLRPAGSRISPYSPPTAGSLAFRPNLFFTQLLLRLNAQRLAARIREALPQAGSAPAAALLGCSVTTSRLPDVGWAHNRVQLASAIAPTDWDMQLAKPEVAEKWSRYEFYDGSANLDGAVAYELLKLTAPKLAKLQPYGYLDAESPARSPDDRRRERARRAPRGRRGGRFGEPLPGTRPLRLPRFQSLHASARLIALRFQWLKRLCQSRNRILTEFTQFK